MLCLIVLAQVQSEKKWLNCYLSSLSETEHSKKGRKCSIKPSIRSDMNTTTSTSKINVNNLNQETYFKQEPASTNQTQLGFPKENDTISIYV